MNSCKSSCLLHLICSTHTSMKADLQPPHTEKSSLDWHIRALRAPQMSIGPILKILWQNHRQQVHSLWVDSRPGDRLLLAKGPPPSLHYCVKLSLKLTARLRRWPWEKERHFIFYKKIIDLSYFSEVCTFIDKVKVRQNIIFDKELFHISILSTPNIISF